MIRFLHAADLHLDSPLRGLQRYEGCPHEAMRVATRNAFERLVLLALEEKVHFVVVAGDVFDGTWQDYNTGLFFNAQLARLRDAAIPVYLISGNHDAQNKMTKDLRLPDNVHRLDAAHPETVLLPELNVAIHGQGFAKQQVFDDLSAGYPTAIAGLFNIGLLHTSANCADGHEPYAPCTLDGLRTKGYDYWALGHVHTRRILCEDPWIVFPGNIQGRSIRETGARGCMVVELGSNKETIAKFHTLDVARWEHLKLNIQDLADVDSLIPLLAGQLALLANKTDMLMAARIEIEGETRLHSQFAARTGYWTEEIRNLANLDFPGRVWIEKVVWNSKGPVRRQASVDAGPLSELREQIAQLRSDPARLAELSANWEDWSGVVGRCREICGAEPTGGSELLDEVEALLQQRLTGDSAS